MDTRTKMLEAAERLLDESPDRDIATRAVCEAAGVGAPVLYRLFGDKNGLLSALVDYGFERYLGAKRSAGRSEDPVADLRSGWDTHTGFALAHPAVYRLMFSPHLAEMPSASKEAFSLLEQALARCAAVGRLRVEPRRAAQAVMSANVGVALNLVSQPDVYTDPGLSHRVRDALFRDLLTEDPGAAAAEPGGPDAGAAALRLAALLPEAPGVLTGAESALLREWLDRISAGAAGR
ncbi:TetR/AcrR family transcriptional regulator [Nocardiopsis sp. CT-R113]|uniref:TetR/AcrR family transcriptional regulator n=1 Tax=Nocardiopsis codii TaxID=3065942 RepID=A0ABU7KGE6_9ACTN|nr:TetR/AcrR family transcriptional regulator [Nocardiopsis sp. CT-R113]MEE2041107.1 TetR/AcrR family transcriptional regulator [Nocardiopsis sp. CT-R113]